MADRIRVYQIIKTLNIGGAERFGIELAKALDRDKFSVKLFVYFRDDSPIEQFWLERLAADHLEVHFLSVWKGNNDFASYYNGIRTLRHLLKGETADLLHSHFQLGTLAALHGRLTGLTRRVLRTAHNHPRKEWDPGLYGALRYQVISKWIYPQFLDAEAAVSSAITMELKQHPGARFSKKPILTIYNAFSPEIIGPVGEDQAKQGNPSRFVIGSIGRLAEQKGYRFLIQAIPAVIAAHPEVQFWLVGDGDQREMLENQARQLELTDHLQFLGKRTDALELLRQMDLFVLPSLWEGLPTVLMESAANNVPIVATDISGNNEIVTKDVSGWLVPPKDSEALAAALLEAIERADLRARRASQARKDLSQFSISTIASQYADLYQQLLK